MRLTSQCGKIASITLPSDCCTAASGSKGEAKATVGAQPLMSKFAVAFERGASCERLRLKIAKTAAARPGSGFVVEGAQLVRGQPGITQCHVSPSAPTAHAVPRATLSTYSPHSVSTHGPQLIQCLRARAHTHATYFPIRYLRCTLLTGILHTCSSVVGVMQVRGAYEIALPAGDADVVATIDYTL